MPIWKMCLPCRKYSKSTVFNTQTETSRWARKIVCLQCCYTPQRWYSSSSQSLGALQCHIHVQCHAWLQRIMVQTHSHSADRRCRSDPSAWALCAAIQTSVWKHATNIHTWQHLFSWNISKGTTAEKSLQCFEMYFTKKLWELSMTKKKSLFKRTVLLL